MSEDMIDGEGADGWRLDLLPTWLRRDLAPFTAAARAMRLSNLLEVLNAASPPQVKEGGN